MRGAFTLRLAQGKRSAFTLIELLIVIGIVGVLASIVIVAVNPNKQLGAANDAWRKSSIREIQNAIVQYVIEEGSLPDGIPTGRENRIAICRVGITDPSCINLDELISGDFVADLPVDTAETDANLSGFTVYKEPGGFVVVEAGHLGQAGGATTGGGGDEEISCFVAGTPISLANGSTRNIDDLHVSDQVLGYEEGWRINTVQQVFPARIANGYYRLHIGDRILEVTAEHPFFIGNGQYRNVSALRTGDTLYEKYGDTLRATQLTSKAFIEASILVYNIRTDGSNNYLARNVLVHNKSLAGSSSSSADASSEAAISSAAASSEAAVSSATTSSAAAVSSAETSSEAASSSAAVSSSEDSSVQSSSEDFSSSSEESSSQESSGSSVMYSEEGYCADYMDNDGDWTTDCGDSDCYWDPACASSSSSSSVMYSEAGYCADYSDNDYDGFYDCSDSDCYWDPSCSGSSSSGM